jgi:hypothetical protein
MANDYTNVGCLGPDCRHLGQHLALASELLQFQAKSKLRLESVMHWAYAEDRVVYLEHSKCRKMKNSAPPF